MILAVDDLESIAATLELLGDADAQARIAQSEADVAAGNVFSRDEIEADLDRRRRNRT